MIALCIVLAPIKAHSEPTTYVPTDFEFLADGQTSQRAYYAWELTEKAEKLIGTKQGQCTMAVRKFLGLSGNEIKGLAKNNEKNSNIPEIGAVIITNESKWGHVAVVLNFTDTEVTFYESNVPLGSEIAGIRTLKLTDSRIVGYKILE